MSKLVITEEEMEKAIEQYFRDYENELYKKFDFESLQIIYNKGTDELKVEVEER